MKMALLGPAASEKPTESSLSILALLLVASFSVGCSDDDRDPTTDVLDSSVTTGMDAAAADSGARDAGSSADAAAPPDAGAADSAAPVDSGSTQPDASQPGMDASPDASADGGDPADGSLDGAAGDAAAQDAATDAAQDATADASDWPVPGCDQSYRFVARNQSGGKFQVGSGDHYQTFTFNAPWNNQEVQAIAFRLVLDNEEIVKRLHLQDANTGAVLAQFAAGDDRFVLPSNVGVALPSGSGSVRLGVRYLNTANSNRSDASGIDVCIVRGDNLRDQQAAVSEVFGGGHPAIPANTANVEVTATCDVNNVQPVYLLSAGPYAHPDVVWTKFTVFKKNGDEIVMHHQAYEFGERSVFPRASEVEIEKGDRVETTCVFTNEADQELPAEDTLETACSNLALYYPAGVLDCTPVP